MSAALLRIVGGTVVVIFLVAAFTPAVDLLAAWMTPAGRSEPAQAIVVLGAGGVSRAGYLTNTSMRGAMEGIGLYQQGLAPLVVFSGSPEGSPRGEAEARADLARSCGVPASAVLTSSRARTTSQEAQRIHALLAPRQIRKIVLVVKAPGMTRATRVFERVGFEVVATPWTDVLDVDRAPGARLSLLRQIAMELVALVYYRAAGYL
jgi:uncharacterized SAM-binding protein YcdF (DUF218 family)